MIKPNMHPISNRMYRARLWYSPRPSSTALMIVEKLSSLRIMTAARLATSVPAAHRDPDVGLLQRGRVVDAVAGHGDDLALAAEHVHQADLVLRGDAGDHADIGDPRPSPRRRSSRANSAPLITVPSMPSWRAIAAAVTA